MRHIYIYMDLMRVFYLIRKIFESLLHIDCNRTLFAAVTPCWLFRKMFVTFEIPIE